jgi:hypothetical protein
MLGRAETVGTEMTITFVVTAKTIAWLIVLACVPSTLFILGREMIKDIKNTSALRTQLKAKASNGLLNSHI